jgi:four helix bundle protein
MNTLSHPGRARLSERAVPHFRFPLSAFRSSQVAGSPSRPVGRRCRNARPLTPDSRLPIPDPCFTPPDSRLPIPDPRPPTPVSPLTPMALSAKDLDVYQQAYALAMDVFRASKLWPVEEKYALTDQIRRSSRSVCANLREAWCKRQYEAHFVSKLSDSDAENSETETWLDFARDCSYLAAAEHGKLSSKCREVGAMLGSMLKNPTPFLLRRPPTADSRPLPPAGDPRSLTPDSRPLPPSPFSS